MAVTFVKKSAEQATEIEGANIQPQFVNRFQVVVATDHVRIIFGDAAVGMAATYHSAVVMTITDAQELKVVLQKLLEAHRPSVPD